MQFREFGEWISRLSSQDDERYLIFGSQSDVNQLVLLTARAGMTERFHFHRTTGVEKGRIYVAREDRPGDSSFSVAGLREALEAAERADLKRHLVEEAMTSFDNDGPYSYRFTDDFVPLGQPDPGATHPEGEDESPDPVSDLIEKISKKLDTTVDRANDFLRDMFSDR